MLAPLNRYPFGGFLLTADDALRDPVCKG
jgi:hypothetical protein